MENKTNARTEGNEAGANAKTDGEMMGKDITDFPINIPENADLEQPPIFEANETHGFPDLVFDNLPDLFKNACAILTEQTEREVFLIGAIGVASGLLPNVRGFYDGQYTACNLYCYVLGQYGTGKGGLKLAYQIGKAVHARRKEISAELQAKYKQDCIEAKENKEPEPANPGSKLLFIPANNSKSGFVELLHDNDGRGILFETEGDITPPHLSHVFRRERITEEIKQKAITAFNLSPDYFDKKGSPLFDPQSPDAKKELDEYRALVVELKNQVREWREKWEEEREKRIQMQDEYLEHLKNRNKSE